MSIDVIVLKPVGPAPDSLEDVAEAEVMGRREFVRDRVLEPVFPGLASGSHARGDRWSIECAYAGDPVTSLHLALRGLGEDYDDLLDALARICLQQGWAAYLVADNSRLA